MWTHVSAILTLVASFVVSGPSARAAQASTVELVPRPKQAAWSAGPGVVLAKGKVAIVVGDRATPPEAYAAEQLQKSVLKRFGERWPVAAEGRTPGDAEIVVLLGQRATHARLNEQCREHKIDLGTIPDLEDAYAIEVTRDEGRTIVAIVGKGARGVIYGQDTLFQMLVEGDDGVALHAASVRDWPTVPMRGRPQTSVSAYQRAGELDLYAMSRINFIDLRSGIYAFEVNEKLDRKQITQVIGEAHRRGMIVYGTVNCAVPREEHAAVMKMFGEFIELGVDGLWVSFDDKGPGEAPEELVGAVVKLGAAHGMTRNLLAITPPKGAYQEVLTDFNRRIMKVEGMAEALWFWTHVPCAADLEDARSIGMTTKPSWWHNWTRPHSGFTHMSSASLLAGGRRSYLPVPTLAEGWHSPTYEALREAGLNAQAIMPWGGNGWGQYYVVPVIGWWGWDAEVHDFDATRRRIYGIVFGRDQVEPAAAFDDALLEAESKFRYAAADGEWVPTWPPRLKDETDRAEVLSALDKADGLMKRIAAGAAKQTMLDGEELREDYLEPMRREAEFGRNEAQMAYPEYGWIGHQRELLGALYAGDDKLAEGKIRNVRDRVLKDVGRIESALSGLRYVKAYGEWWRRRVGMKPADWRAELAARQEALAERIKDYGHVVKPTGVMLEDLAKPPLDWGTGRWVVTNRRLATVSARAEEVYWGDWIGGLYTHGKSKVAVFALERKQPTEAGTFCELPVSVPISGPRGRLALLVYLANVNKDAIGLHHVRSRWAEHRFVQLLLGEQVLWEQDLGVDRQNGAWFKVKLPVLPDAVKQAELRLRVEERRTGDNNYAIVFVGPIHLIELGEWTRD